MPKLMNQSASLVAQTASHFKFSGKKPDELGASEYTLVDIQIDVSPSVTDYLGELNEALKLNLETLADPKLNPRCDNTLMRVSSFSENLAEIHGFNELKDLNPSGYNLTITGGGTNLYGATLNGLEALTSYGATLYALDYLVNGLLVVVTDGEENTWDVTIKKILDARARFQIEEKFESLKMILLGVGDQARVKSFLDKFKDEAKFDQFEWENGTTKGHFAHMAGFISRSVSSSSKALGTGGPSKNLTF